jgi:hypothetical protein
VDAADEADTMSDNPVRIVRAGPVRITRAGGGDPVRVVMRDAASDLKVHVLPVGIPGEDGEDGADGREVEIRKGATHVEWRRVGDESWQPVISFSELLADQTINGGDF